MPEDKAIIPANAQFLLAFAASLLGIPLPLAGGVTGAVAAAVEEAQSRRQQRRHDRLIRIVNNLEQRLRDVEFSVSDDEERVDLFFEVVEKAVNDDEARKELFYSGVLEWVLRSKPPLAQVRVLSDAVKGLSFTELAYFVFRHNGRSPRNFIDRELPAEIAHSRLQNYGLSETGMVQVNKGATRLGDILAQHCSMEDVFNLLTPSEQRFV